MSISVLDESERFVKDFFVLRELRKQWSNTWHTKSIRGIQKVYKAAGMCCEIEG